MTASRYLVLIAECGVPPSDYVRRVEQRTGLSVVFEKGRTLILASPDRLVTFPNDGGVVLGSLFERRGPPRAVHTIDDATAEAIITSAGGGLIEQFWGGYVAVLCAGERTVILRDPSGALPCYFVRAPGLVAFASDAGVLRDAGLLMPAIDWKNVVFYLFSSGLPTSATSLTGLKELLPGTAATIHETEVAIEMWWSPWDHVAIDPLRDERDNAEHLKRVVQGCVSALASSYPRILLGASGGLDSSIVGASLAATRATLICMTMVTEDPEGDERDYVRLLRDALGVELVEDYYSLDQIDLLHSCVAHLPRPSGRTHALAYDRAMHRAAGDHAIDAYFSGNGGDNVFAYSQSATSIYDRFRHEGIGRGVVRTLSNVCRQTGCTPWQAARSAFKVAGAGSHSYRWRADPRFLNADLVRELERRPLQHPWLSAPKGALPGKAAHIAALLRILPHLEGYDRALHVPMINPLMCQPVVEACLAIPSWQWVAAGRNRAVARRAFQDMLPPAIVNRTSKGGPDGFANQVIDHSRAQIRERLLDGRLAAQGLLDRDRLDDVLSDRRPNLGVEQVRILSLLDTEAWLDHWLATTAARSGTV
ncbi:MAG: asparagine synthase [Bradyrhizobium sp.]|nr:asparagine synthase [Bradyrhizobium sp.]